MTDRELLELAAKANGGLVYVNGLGWIHEDDGGDRGAWWNPLADDGDALRLAGKLDMTLTFSLAGFAQACSHDGCFDVDYDGDRQRAMRLAIVRAAAEIGKGL